MIEGRDLISVQNLLKKQNALQSEIQGHQSHITKVCDFGNDMLTADHFASETITECIDELCKSWEQLKVHTTLNCFIYLHSFIFNNYYIEL